MEEPWHVLLDAAKTHLDEQELMKLALLPPNVRRKIAEKAGMFLNKRPRVAVNSLCTFIRRQFVTHFTAHLVMRPKNDPGSYIP